MKWRNQLLALFCLVVFLGFGVFYFRYWVVQKPFGIILFIGEGMSPGRLAMTRVFAGGADKALSIDSLSYSALLRNYSRDSVTPDAAAAATALATGTKVKNGAIGVDAEGKALENLLELARASGRMTGLVTNGDLTDATVAGFYAHSSAKDGRSELARELVEQAQVDLVLGGGAQDFLPDGKGGRRTDERDLLEQLKDAGYDIVRTGSELDKIPRWRQAKLFGLFGDADFNYAEPQNKGGDQPSLADMVRRGIELLQFNSGGYLLVVDAGLMRKAAQSNDTRRTLSETLELDRAVAVALDYAGEESTILVCGDVAVGGLELNGSLPRKVNGEALFETAEEDDWSFTWATGPRGPGLNDWPKSPSPTDEINDALEGPPLAPTPRTTTLYSDPALNTAGDVAAFGIGLGADALHGILENTAIFEIVRDNL